MRFEALVALDRTESLFIDSQIFSLISEFLEVLIPFPVKGYEVFHEKLPQLSVV